MVIERDLLAKVLKTVSIDDSHAHADIEIRSAQAEVTKVALLDDEGAENSPHP